MNTSHCSVSQQYFKQSTLESTSSTLRQVQKLESIDIGIKNSCPVLNFLPRKFNAKLHMIQLCGKPADGVLIMTTDLLMYGLGINRNGQLGIGNISETQKPIKIETLCGEKIKKLIYLSKPIVFALTEEGQVYSWGSNENGILGLGQNAPLIVHTPGLIYTLMHEHVVDIASSGIHAVALTKSGKIYLWGKLQYTKCDKKLNYICDYYIEHLPKIFWNDEFGEVKHICCGENFTIAQTQKGLYGSGINNNYQLGTFTQYNHNLVTFVELLTDGKRVIVKIVCGCNHVMALSDKGNLFVWGDNKYGQLGIHRSMSKAKCILNMWNNKMGKIVDIAALSHRNTSVALNTKECVYVWGCYGDICEDLPREVQVSDMYEVFGCDLPYIITSTTKYSDNFQDTDEVSGFFQNMETMFDDSSMSDLTIRVKGQPIYVHKAILNISSKYFRNMFQQTEWKENNQSVIEHDQFSYDVFKSFLKYLYTNEIDLPVEKTLDLLILADTYKETSLMNCCIQILKKFAIENIDHFATMILNTIRKS